MIVAGAGGGLRRRLFFALWPDAAERRALEAQRLRCCAPAGHWPRGEDLHSTLLFLGAVPASRLTALCDAAARIAVRGFALHLDALVRERPRALAERATGAWSPLRVHATRFCLVESRPAAVGARYTLLEDWPLG